MYRVAILGDKDSIFGFSALGVDLFPVEEKVNASETLRNIANQDYAIIFITEKLAASIKDEIYKYKDKIVPAIILIPGISGNTGEGMSNISEIVRKAVGADIIS